MKALEDLCEVLEGQVKKISMKGDAISPQELDNAYKAVDIIKDIKTIDAMKKAEEQEMKGGYSQDYSYGSMRRPYFHMYPSYDRGGSYEGGSYEGSYDGSYDDMSRRSYEQGGQSNARRGRDGDNDGRYSEEYSQRRGRDARTGRYVSRDGGSYEGSYDGYSGHDEQQKEQMKRQIQEMQQKLNQM